MTAHHVQISRAELARRLGVSRTYVTLLAQGKRTPGQLLANKLTELMLTVEIPGESALTHTVEKGYQ